MKAPGFSKSQTPVGQDSGMRARMASGKRVPSACRRSSARRCIEMGIRSQAARNSADRQRRGRHPALVGRGPGFGSLPRGWIAAELPTDGLGQRNQPWVRCLRESANRRGSAW